MSNLAGISSNGTVGTEIYHDYVNNKHPLLKLSTYWNAKSQDAMIGAATSFALSSGAKYGVMGLAMTMGTAGFPVTLAAAVAAGAATGTYRFGKQIYKERKALADAGEVLPDLLSKENFKRLRNQLLVSTFLSGAGGTAFYALTHMDQVADFSRSMGFEAGAQLVEKAHAGMGIAGTWAKQTMYTGLDWTGSTAKSLIAQTPAAYDAAKNGITVAANWVGDNGHAAVAYVSSSFNDLTVSAKHGFSSAADWVKNQTKSAIAYVTGEKPVEMAKNVVPKPSTTKIIDGLPVRTVHTTVIKMPQVDGTMNAVATPTPTAVAEVAQVTPPDQTRTIVVPTTKVHTVSIKDLVASPVADVAAAPAVTPTSLVPQVAEAVKSVPVVPPQITSVSPIVAANTQPIFDDLSKKPLTSMEDLRDFLKPKTAFTEMAKNRLPLMASLPDDMPNFRNMTDPFTGKTMEFPIVIKPSIDATALGTVNPEAVVATPAVVTPAIVPPLPAPEVSFNDKLAQLVEGKHLRRGAAAIYKHAMEGDAQSIKDLAKAVANGQMGFSKDPQKAIELYRHVIDLPDVKENLTAKMQAKVDMAYFKFHGAGDLVENHKEAIAEMTPLAKKSSIARSLLAEWTGKPLHKIHHAASVTRNVVEQVHEKVAGHVGKDFGKASCTEIKNGFGDIAVKCRGLAASALKDIKVGSDFKYTKN